jgi:very-short-patch-repair endonuclease
VGSVSRASDGDLARLAGRHRVLTVVELYAAGLSDEAIEYRVSQGRLQRLWTGVYLVGSAPPPPLSLAYGAVASCAGDAYVGRYWGAFVLGFGAEPSLPVNVLVIRGSRRGRPEAVKPYRSTTLEARDLGSCEGIKVTSPARTILDCAETATLPQLEALVAAAHAKNAVTYAQLEDVLGRAGRRRAAARLRAVLTDTSGGMTLSEAERILRRLLKQAGLAQPLTNYAIGRYRADFCWPQFKLIVEFDSWAHHGHRQGFRHDRRRNSHLTAKGWSVLPVTDEMLRREPFRVVALITEALTRREAATA